LKYYSVFLPIIDSEKKKRFQSHHLDYLRKMEQEEKIFAQGQYTDEEGELVIYIAESFEQVHSFVQKDPFVVQQVSDYEIHEWDMELSINVIERHKKVF
jgi:uncharacterized protein YciI